MMAGFGTVTTCSGLKLLTSIVPNALWVMNLQENDKASSSYQVRRIEDLHILGD